MAKATESNKINALIKFFEAGMPITEIAETLGLNSSTVHRILGRLGLKEPCKISGKRLSEVEKVDIVQLYKDGVVVEQIMELLGCSKPTVYKYVKQAGLSREITEDRVEQAIFTYQKTKMTVAEICKQYGLSKPTFYRRLKAHTEK